MRNAVLLAGIWVTIILIAYAVAFLPDRAPSGFVAVDRTFASGTLEFPVPAGWSVLETDYGAAIASPVSAVEGWAVAAEGDTPEAALADAWAKIDPCPSCARPVAEPFVAETSWTGQTRATFTYASGDNGGRVHGVVLGSAPQWGVLLIETGTDPIRQRVSADLDRIEEGFSVETPSAAPVEEQPAGTTQPEPAAEATI
ncbi:MAG: hypothetical protein NTY63_07135 [Candidatus Bipolaricaulota bacterium]|nr:hypothetical protein [Candidatus Bipolaricaulota bacterium]